MTDGHSTDTGQVSVAELLARNGQKAPARPGGRRRRGVSGGISVAELTGEIPLTPRFDEPGTPPKAEPLAPKAASRTTESASPRPEFLMPPAPRPETPPIPQVEPVELETPRVEPLELDIPRVEPLALETPVPPPAPEPRDEPDAPEPVKVESPTEIIHPAVLPRRARAHVETAVASPPVRAVDVPEPRLLSGPASDLRGHGDDVADGDTETIGEPVAAPADEAAEEQTEKPPARARRRRGAGTGSPTPAQTGEEKPAAVSDTPDESEAAEPGGGAVGQWARLIGESVVAIIAGALLFKGFEQLWDALPWVAFVLALLVIVGLVATVRILRRTDDIASQLIALAVGAFVTFGPLLFLLPTG